jgi:GNAT superfamily N-acetyltransferase
MTFWTEFKQQTDINPIHRHERVWKARACLRVTPFYERTATLQMIRSLFRGQGYGTAALRWLTRLADRHGITLVGTVEPSGTSRPRLTLRQLTAWYRRHGFTVSRSYHLVRRPRRSQ